MKRYSLLQFAYKYINSLRAVVVLQSGKSLGVYVGVWVCAVGCRVRWHEMNNAAPSVKLVIHLHSATRHAAIWACAFCIRVTYTVNN